MSLTIPQTVSLEELVNRAYYILLVKKLNPFSTEEMLVFSKGLKTCPPFRKITFHFHVIEELCNKSIKSLAGIDLDVFPADLSQNIELYKKLGCCTTQT